MVTGFRQSLQTALDAKRKSDLPSSRWPPKTSAKCPTRTSPSRCSACPECRSTAGPTGEGTAVLIDGLRQNLVTLNGDLFLTGREFYVSGEASGGGAGSNSQYGSLEGIPSELIGGIDVFKNPEASMTEGGLGGTIDLKTARSAGAAGGLEPRRQFPRIECRSARQLDAGWHAGGIYKFNDRLAFTASFSSTTRKRTPKNSRMRIAAGGVITELGDGALCGAC